MPGFLYHGTECTGKGCCPPDGNRYPWRKKYRCPVRKGCGKGCRNETLRYTGYDGVQRCVTNPKRLLHEVTAFALLPSVTVYTLPMVTNSGYTLDHYIITPGNTYTVQKVNKERLHRTATRQVRKGRGGGCRQFRGFCRFAGNIPAAITRAGKMPVCCRFYAAPEPEARSRPGAAHGGMRPKKEKRKTGGKPAGFLTLFTGTPKCSTLPLCRKKSRILQNLAN